MLHDLQAVASEAAVAGLWRHHQDAKERRRVAGHADQGGCGRPGRRRRCLRNLVSSVQGRSARVRQDERGVYGGVVQHVHCTRTLHAQGRAQLRLQAPSRLRVAARWAPGQARGRSGPAVQPWSLSEAPPKTLVSPRSARSCVFTKFNTDEVGGMRSLLEISAMPTFKVFKAKAEVGCQRGWDESRAVLTSTVSPPRAGARYSLTAHRKRLRRRAARSGAQRPLRSRYAPRTPEAWRTVRTVSTTGPKSGR